MKNLNSFYINVVLPKARQMLIDSTFLKDRENKTEEDIERNEYLLHKRNIFREYISLMGCGGPGGPDPFEFDFETTEQLLSHPELVKRSKDKDFYRWSESADSYRKTLMAEYKSGKDYVVVGFFTKWFESGLPTWIFPGNSK